MKKNFRLTTYSSTFFSIRVPMYPLNFLYDFYENELKSTTDTFFDCLLRDESFQQALFLASPKFYRESAKLFDSELSPKNKKGIRITLYKYLARACTRATPFGMFGRYSLGKIANEEYSLELNDQNNNIIYKVSDEAMQELLRLVAEVINLKHCPDDLTFKDTEDFFLKVKGNKVTEKYAKNELERKIFSAFLSSGNQYRSLIEVIANITGARCDNLIENFILQIDATLKEPHSVFKMSKRIEELFANIGSGKQMEKYIEAEVFVQTKKPFILDNTTAETIIKELDELSVEANNHNHPEIQSFMQNFSRIYGDQEVNILELFDEDKGLIYPPQKAETCTFEQNEILVNNSGFSKRFEDSILDKYINSLSKGEIQIEITETDLIKRNLENSLKEYQPGFYVQGTLYKYSSPELKKRRFLFVLKKQSGPAALALVNKPGNSISPVGSSIKDYIVQEEQLINNAIVAELIFSPTENNSHSIYRPMERKYSLILDDCYCDPQLINIELPDLFIYVRNNKFVLYSKKHKKVVIPTLSCPFNFYKESGLTRFLCELQYQYKRPLFEWNWNRLASRSFLPRVTYKHLILSKASWFISYEILQKYLEKGSEPCEVVENIRNLLNIPCLFYAVEGDKELLINSASPLACLAFLNMIKKVGIWVNEFLEEEYQSLTREQGPFYCNEIIIPVLSQQKIDLPLNLDSHRGISIPFQDWTSVKIYGRSEQLQKLLLVLSALLNDFRNQKEIDLWYFLRFNDPDYHVRLRVKIGKGMDRNKVLNKIFGVLHDFALLAMITDVIVDTYKPEFYRYGITSMLLCEEIFYFDSVCKMDLFTHSLPSEDKWLIALLDVEYLVKDLDLNILDKIELYYDLETQFLLRSNNIERNKISFDETFRKIKLKLPSLFDEETVGDYTTFHNIFKTRSSNVKSAINMSNRLYGNDFSNKSSKQLAKHLIHMNLNRHFLTYQNQNELLIYAIARRYYESDICRRKYLAS